jgi:hypothetical protein
MRISRTCAMSDYSVKPSILDSLKALAAALPDAAIAVGCLLTWFAPNLFGEYTVKWVVTLMLLEFIVVHSAGFMGITAYSRLPKLKKAGALLGLTLFYSLFAGGFSWAMHSWWPLVSFWVLCINRMLGGLLGQPPKGGEMAFVASSWGVGAGLYVLGALATVMLPLPAFGISADVIAHQNFGGVSGLWVEEPQRAVAFAFLYFGATALWEFYGVRAFGRKGPARQPGDAMGERMALAEELRKRMGG